MMDRLFKREIRMRLYFERSSNFVQVVQNNHLVYILVVTLLMFVSACSFPSSKTETPHPSPSQEVIQQPTATLPSNPTPTPRPLPPGLVESDPFPNTELDLEGSVTFYFNQSMDRPSVEAAFSGLPGSLSWIDDSTLSYTPNTPLSPGAQLILGFDTQARATNGLPLVEPISLVYHAAGFINLAQTIPQQGATGVDPASSIAATFNRPIIPLGANQDELPVAFSLEPNVAGHGEWLNTSTYVFTPQTSLAGGREYTVQIETDLIGLDGTPLQNAQSWSFTTAEPSLLAVEPENGARDVSLDATILLTFNQPMDPKSVEKEFTLREDENTRLRGEFSWNEGLTEFSFTPDNLLKRDRVYTFELSEEVLSAGGTEIGAPFKAAFRTIPQLSVLASDPVNRGQKDIYSSVSIEFNSPIKFKNVLQFITFNPPVTDLQATTDESGRTMWLSGYFSPDTAYSLIISPNLPDKWNSRLGQEFNLIFRTRPLDPYLAISGASDVIFLTPDQSSVTVQVTNINELTYSLGVVPLEDFLDLMAPDNYALRQGYHPPRELTLLRNLEIPANQNTPVEIPLSLDGGPLVPGIYSLRFNTGFDNVYPGPYLLIVSEINTTLKISASDVLVWAVNLQDGSAVENTPLVVYAESGETLAQGQTDADGILQSEIPVREMEDIYGISYVILGEPGDENFSAALSNWGQGLDGSSFGYQIDYSPPHLQGYIYTDRPIYRPGQLVNFRVILRQAYNGRYELPEQPNLILNLRNEIGEQIATLDLPLSEIGTAQGRYTLPEDIEPGVYRFILDEGGFSSVTFQVAEYRKPEIDLQVVFPETQSLAGEKITGSVTANYFFGTPAGDVPLQWTLLRSPASFHLPGYQVGKADTGWLSGLPGFYYPGYQEEIELGEGKTNSSGSLDIDLNLPVEDERYLYTLEVTALDESGVPVSAQSDLLVNPAQFFIGIRPDSWSGQVGRETGFDIQVVDWDWEPAGAQPLAAEYSKILWERIDPQPGDLRGFPVYEAHRTIVGSVDLVTGTDGKARIAFTPPEPGTYQLEVKGSESTGEGAVTQIILWVGGPGQVEWPNLPNRRLRLTADKDSYQPGETARVFVPNPFGNDAVALVTVERGIQFEHQTVTVNGSGIEIPVNLGNEQAPNIYLSVTLIAPSEEGTADYRQGYLSLPVAPVEQTLAVSLTSEPVIVEPGGEVIMNLLVTDSEGVPVEGEFSLSVVDLAVLALAEANSPDIVPAFYGEQPLGVDTSLSLAGSTQLFSTGPEGIGGGGGDEFAGPLQIREEFLDTAYWNAAIETGADGQAQVRLSLPDNITTWQLDTRGVTDDTRVGQDKNQIISTKDLLVRPVTPRFFVAGDHVLLAAVVHNNTEQELPVEVSLQETGFTLDDPELVLQEVSIPAGGRTRVEWWGTVADVNSVDLVFTASAGEYQDSTRPAWGDGSLPVLRFFAPQTFGTSGIMDDRGERLEVVSLPRSYDPQNGELHLEMAPTLGAAMMSALEVLETSPSDNTEQIVSRFLPNLETYRVIQEFGLEEPGMQTRLESLLDDSISQLDNHQNPDGGWGWWNGNASDPFITAYALYGLIRAEDAGVDLNTSTIAAAIDYLNASLPTADMLVDAWQFDRQALVHYVLSEAGEGDLVGTTGLYTARSKLNPWAQALLALTFENLNPGDDRIPVLYSGLEASALRSATGAHWENREASWQNMSTTLQSTAVVLYALAKQDPASPLVADALRYLMSNRNSSGAWSSTYESAWVLMSLATVMQGTGELSGEFEFSADLNDNPLVVGEAMGNSQLTPVETSTSISSLYPSEPNSLLISRGDGLGRLYYNTHLNVYLPVDDIAPLDQGVSVSRRYFPSDTDCLQESCPEISQAKNGELVTVRLTLTIPETTYYLMVEDYIPAGAEILDMSLNTSQESQFIPEHYLEQGWDWWEFNTPRIYDDRISWAADQLSPGTYELVYQMVALQPGDYRVLPPRASQLYFPEVQGNGQGTIFEINEK